ncbi:bolA-like protein [Penicillium diatomitis]|uniref:BolA-like protein n=1 Tax=Penicillium diatomitis TaxID=2819901 RepID=A0A9W9X2Y5_9EURO|nr:bolA-like protein [Penicillium diatomitis]KAJ5482913.1 bolA-like protein [Penicillium diatomitis]
MFFRTSTITKLSRGYHYLTVPNAAQISRQAPFFSISARSFSAVGAAMADTSGVTAELLQKKLEVELEAKTVKIEDLSGGCGQAFQAVIVSDKFAGKNLLARHRLVNSVLKEEIPKIHAWTPKCYTTEQYQALGE